MNDPFINDVFLLANFTAKDGQTVYTPDIGDFFNFNGNAEFQDTVTLFGNTTVYLDGTGDYLDTGAVGAYNFLHFNDEDWTIELWVRFPSVAASGYAFATRGSSNRGLILGVNAGGVLQCTIYDNVGDVVQLTESGTSVLANTWHYISVTRSGGSGQGSYEIKLDNVSKQTDLRTAQQTGTSNAALTFGKTADTGSFREIEMYLGPTRITKGVARTISSVPTDIFPVPADDDFASVISLLNFEDMTDGTTITDTAPIVTPIPWTSQNGATITSGVLILDGVDQFIISDARTDIRDELNGTNSTSWTIEIKLKTNSSTTATPYYDFRAEPTATGMVIRQPSSPADEVKLSVGDVNAGWDGEITTSALNLTVGEIIEVAVTRNGSDYLMHVDGIYQGKMTTAVALHLGDQIWLGTFTNESSYMDGEIYRARITKDISRYGEDNYSPYPGFRYPAPPTITTQPTAQTVSEGAVATFTVVASNATGYQWYETTAGLLSDETAATLDFTTAITDDGNSYYCSISNADGSISTDTVGLTVLLNLEVKISDAGPLGLPSAVAFNNFESLITDLRQVYVMNITGTPVLELPISSWQGTLNTSESNFAQCVIPNVDSYIDEITSRQGAEEFVIYKTTIIAGNEVRAELIRVPLQTVTYYEGAFKGTATLQGYTTGPTANPTPKTRLMQDIRTETTSATGLRRVRCTIDWYLIPGDTATVRGTSFVVNYISYFCSTSGDIYMDIGDQ